MTTPTVKKYNRIRPVNGGIVLDMKFEDRFSQNVGGIILPDATVDREAKEVVRARILAIDTAFYEGKTLPVKVGDVVVVKRHAGLEIEMGQGGSIKRVVQLEHIGCILEGYVVPPPAEGQVKARKAVKS